jgi:hypothetical protein
MSSVFRNERDADCWMPPSSRRSLFVAAICAPLFAHLIVANNLLESEISEMKKAVSHAYTRGRFRTCTG